MERVVYLFAYKKHYYKGLAVYKICLYRKLYSRKRGVVVYADMAFYCLKFIMARYTIISMM